MAAFNQATVIKLFAGVLVALLVYKVWSAACGRDGYASNYDSNYEESYVASPWDDVVRAEDMDDDEDMADDEDEDMADDMDEDMMDDMQDMADEDIMDMEDQDYADDEDYDEAEDVEDEDAEDDYDAQEDFTLMESAVHDPHANAAFPA
jgi:hypothetical protein